MKIGDEVYIHGYIDEIRKDTIIIKNDGGYFGTIPSEISDREPEPCEDCISRQAVLDELDNHRYSNEFCEEYHIDWSINLGMAHIVINGLPSVNPQEPNTGHCEDCISRAELLKAIDTWDKFGCDANTKLVPYKDHYVPYIHYDDVIKCIKGMPIVRQKSDVLDKIMAIVKEWKDDSWTDGLSYECMIKISELFAESEV